MLKPYLIFKVCEFFASFDLQPSTLLKANVEKKSLIFNSNKFK